MTREQMINEAVRRVAMWQDESRGKPYGATVRDWCRAFFVMPENVERIRAEFRRIAQEQA